ncbi:MAG: MaoC family dehydratase [Patulibacter sp.]
MSHPASPRTITGIAELRRLVGEELGVAGWIDVTQPEIDRFADATGDQAWMHVDPRRAAASELGTTIAHGLYTLSLGPRCSYEIYAIEGVDVVLNYGFERVRFPAPLPVGSRVRMHARLEAVEPARQGVLCRIEQRFEREGHERPVCVATSVLAVIGDGD